MAKVIEITVYTFDELSDAAKKAAVNWYSNDLDIDFSSAIEDVNEIAGILGISIDRRSNSNALAIYFSVSYSQGDGACFEGDYAYKKGALRAIKSHAPNDEWLHSIAKRLQHIQSHNFYSLTARIKHNSPHYYHSNSVSIDVEDMRDEWRDCGSYGDDLAKCLRDFMDWSHSQFESEYNYQVKDKTIIEMIRANDYLFTESGEYYDNC